VNGTLTIDGNIWSEGGGGGLWGLYTCSGAGAAGSGGAIRLIATTIAGSGYIYARSAGKVRLEAFANNFPGGHSNPVETRAPAPGPIVNPMTASVAITSVDGETVSLVNGELLSELPQGGFGLIDVQLPAPGVVDVGISARGVPSGTTVDVTMKPSPGGTPYTESVLLDPADCDAAGDCTATAAFDLAAGRFVIEAVATFQTP
jgi:hypothetical protein